MATNFNSYIGYKGSYLKWRSQIDLPESSITKILKNLRIISSPEIRRLLRNFVNKNKALFSGQNCYICRFGETGKSGDVLLYEFKHALKEYGGIVKDTWEIASLPPKSRIILIDDLVGTGTQSTRYIREKLNPFTNASHRTYLLCICATVQGKKYVEANTDTRVIECLLLNEGEHQFLNNKCKIFEENEKKYLREINDKLQDPAEGYSLGLLLAFYFTVPNNSMPIIWKDRHQYLTSSGKQKNWTALLPREY